MATKKAILVPISVAKHLKFKHQCGQLGISMSQAIRYMIDAFLDGDIKMERDGLKTAKHLPASWQRPASPGFDVYDELAERTKQVLGDGMHPVNQ